MRQLIMIAGFVGLFMYVGFVAELGETAAVPARRPAESAQALRPLADGLAATGAALDRAQLTGWVQIYGGQRSLEKVRTALGWSEGQHKTGEECDLKLLRRDGAEYLSVQWVMTGERTASWHQAYERLQGALNQVGERPQVTVQLEGETSQTGVLDQATAAVQGAGGTSLEPWQGNLSASVTGKSPRLPASSYGINLQAAARQQDSGAVRVWIAWPALLQDY